MRIDIDPMPPMGIDIDLHDLDIGARDIARAQADLAVEASRLDVQHLREQAREASRLAMEDMRFNIDVDAHTRMAADIAQSVAPLAAMAPIGPIGPIGPIAPREMR
jgi:hypothetical protein